MTTDRYKSFKDFYPFYLAEHSHSTNRILHFVGTSIILILLAWGLATQNYKALWLCPVVGYGFAWIGHFFFEKNRPATFKYPIYSLMGDFVMWSQLISRKITF